MSKAIPILRKTPNRIVGSADGRHLVWNPAHVAFMDVDAALFQAAQSFGHAGEAEPPVDIAALLDCGLLEAGTGDREVQGVVMQPVGYRLVLTEACNFVCPDCFSTTALKRQGQRLRSMDLDTMDCVIDQIASQHPFGTPVFYVHFFGGEPLLRIAVIRHAAQRMTQLHHAGKLARPSFGITTNGSQISDEILECLGTYGMRVGVSVEITPQVHDAIRRTTQGLPTFDLVRENFFRLRDHGLDPYILVTPYEHCIDEFPARLDALLAMFGPTRVTINTPFDMNTLGWTVAPGYAAMLVECERLCLARGVEVDSALTGIVSAIAEGRRRLSPQAIYGNKVLVAVDPAGRFSSSPQLWTGRLVLGPHLQANPAMLSSFEPECFRCDAQFVCGGPNREYQFKTGLRLDERKCAFFLEAIDAIAENLDVFVEGVAS
jgi:sulfatase maturation enzyme AslB (radical SAM superfamily)